MSRPFGMTAAVRGGLRLLAGGLLMSSLLGCGYKGPLYLPPPEAPPAALTEPPAQSTLPGASNR